MDARLFTEVMYLAKTIWAEARDQGPAGMELVAWVVRNRVESSHYPDSYAAVVTQPGQFSVWLRSDPHRDAMTDPLAGPGADDRAWFEAVETAWKVIHAGARANPLPEVLHYVDVRLEKRLPHWAVGMTPIRRPEAPRLIFLRGPARNEPPLPPPAARGRRGFEGLRWQIRAPVEPRGARRPAGPAGKDP